MAFTSRAIAVASAIIFASAAAAQSTTAPAPTIAAAAGITLRSVSVTLPSSDRMFPGGSAAEAINDNCLTCHSAGMVLTQPKLTSAEWEREVSKMRDTYKAPIDAGDVAAIVAYLANIGAEK